MALSCGIWQCCASGVMVLQVVGPCAVPFTLEKQTALRVSLINLLGPVLNVFHTAVKQVCIGTGMHIACLLGSLLGNDSCHDLTSKQPERVPEGPRVVLAPQSDFPCPVGP
jgi:hypothetical protein